MPKEIFVFRHGAVEGRSDVCKGNKLDVALSDAGRRQTEANVRLLIQVARNRPLEILHSPLKRCSAVQEFAPKNTRVRKVDALRDIDIGSLEGMTYTEVEAAFPGLLKKLRDNARDVEELPEADEPIAKFRARNLEVYQSVLESDAEVTGIFTHGCDVEELLAAARGGGDIHYLRQGHGNGSLIVIDSAKQGVILENLKLYDGEALKLWEYYSTTSSL